MNNMKNISKDTITLDEAIWRLRLAKKNGWYGFVDVTIPGQNKCESIVNHPSSIDNKISYYRSAYNKDGTHKTVPGIRMVNAGTIKRYNAVRSHTVNPIEI